MGEILILLAQRDIEPAPLLHNRRLQIEENVGEDIHIHFRNRRDEFSTPEFMQYAEAIIEAYNRLKDRESKSE